MLAAISLLPEREMCGNVCRILSPFLSEAIFWGITAKKPVWSRLTHKKMTPKLVFFALCLPLLGKKTVFYDKILPREPFSTWKCGISQIHSCKTVHKWPSYTASLPLTLWISALFSLIVNSTQKQRTSDIATLYSFISVGSLNMKCTKIYAEPWPLWC